MDTFLLFLFPALGIQGNQGLDKIRPLQTTEAEGVSKGLSFLPRCLHSCSPQEHPLKPQFLSSTLLHHPGAGGGLGVPSFLSFLLPSFA